MTAQISALQMSYVANRLAAEGFGLLTAPPSLVANALHDAERAGIASFAERSPAWSGQQTGTTGGASA